jgi:hypothetical protein
VPRQRRFRQRELGRELSCDIEASVAQRGHGAGGATELRGEPRAPNAGELRSRLDDGDEPARRLQAERGGERLLQQRARRHHGGSVPVGQRRGCGGRLLQVGQDDLEAAPRDQHHRRVEDVLTRRAAVHVGSRFLRHGGPQRVDQRNHGIGAADGGPAELSDVELVDPAVIRDAIGRRRRDEADSRLGSC